MANTANSNTAVSNEDRVAERLLAYASLCRRIARRSWSEEAAGKVLQFADECVRAAAESRDDHQNAAKSGPCGP